MPTRRFGAKLHGRRQQGNKQSLFRHHLAHKPSKPEARAHPPQPPHTATTRNFLTQLHAEAQKQYCARVPPVTSWLVHRPKSCHWPQWRPICLLTSPRSLRYAGACARLLRQTFSSRKPCRPPSTVRSCPSCSVRPVLATLSPHMRCSREPFHCLWKPQVPVWDFLLRRSRGASLQCSPIWSRAQQGTSR
ncbi:unnamed protein product [Chondrus crispus]|uniref:Uncharacterized protein n=1 Tax=Chondrus crispus TaxID=2769 RepID=R7QEV2_CHOCR|nr:unnamed protein product [Chondrus crispus]CDF35950.1 unnamed protein product [Chondrus crispus]|eukprot:XP_005715769.1 unnamed protein product [Chondrus crispus]